MSDQRQDDQGPVRPQGIDLEAEEISTEPETPRKPHDTAKPEIQIEAEAEEAREAFTPPPPPPPPSPPPAAKRKARGGTAAAIVAALVIGAVGGGWLYRDVLFGYFPPNEVTALQSRLAALEENGGTLADQLAGLKQAADGATQSAAQANDAAQAASQQANAAASGIADIGPKLDALDQRLAAAEQGLKSASTDLDSFRKSISTAVTPTGSSPVVDNAALAALGQRIDALEKDMASLKASAPAGGSEQASVTSALSQALSDLKAKVAAGTAYAAEYERIERMVPAAAGLETVGAHAAEGLPDAKGLAAELRAAIPALPQPAPPPAEDNSYFGSLVKSLSGVVTVRTIGETDWPAVAEKAAGLAESGDINQAIAVIDGAEGEKPMALSQWRDRAAQRLQLEAALSQVSEAVLRQIAAMGGAQQ